MHCSTRPSENTIFAHQRRNCGDFPPGGGRLHAHCGAPRVCISMLGVQETQSIHSRLNVGVGRRSTPNRLSVANACFTSAPRFAIRFSYPRERGVQMNASGGMRKVGCLCPVSILGIVSDWVSLDGTLSCPRRPPQGLQLTHNRLHELRQKARHKGAGGSS